MSPISEQEFSAYDFIDNLDMQGAFDDEKRLRSFLCACSRQIWNNLPKVAQNALVIAEKYNQSLVSKEQLVAERVKLWKFWDATPDHFNNPTREANAVRAVICCMYENIQKYEALDYVRDVMDYCNAVESKEKEQYCLLQEIFDT